MEIEGFKFYKACSCGGVYQRKYWQLSDKTNQYHIYTRKGQVKILKENRNVGVYPLSQLEQKLKEHGII